MNLSRPARVHPLREEVIPEMKKYWKVLPGAAVAMFALAACGNSASGMQQPAGNAPASAAAVSVKNVDGVGQTLVDANGKTLYFTDQEAGGMLKCTANCLTIWIPATGTAGGANAVSGVSVEKRSDTGMDQLTFQGKPLYTFKLDTAAGQHQGNNAHDAFGGTSFTWHAATTTAAAPTQPAPTQNGGGSANGY
jgi:predicted lipoprotein with Yx(FWY)xxD motif